jgi:predicted regulator of Ras-like GTPase activity (Roadblock/LC7/MglB family)
MAETVAGFIEHIAHAPHVRLALAVSQRDGLVVHSAGEEVKEAATVAALFASLYRRAAAVARAQNGGETRFIRFEASGGDVLASAVGTLLLVVIVRMGANLGRMRLELLRAKEIKQ